MTEIRELSRLKALERSHILDEATRKRRQKKALEALEKDNFQDDFPASSTYVSDYRLQLNKKFQQRFTIENDDDDTNPKEKENNLASGSNQNNANFINTSGLGEASNTTANDASTSKRRRIKPESKLRVRKTFAALYEEEYALSGSKKYNYFNINVGMSRFPPRKFCAVCGFHSNYTCIQCGSRYCSTKCLQTHQDTRQ